jgi:hypothetical protein
VNDESNGERTDIERDTNERMAELGRRSGEARRRKKQQQLEPVGDREQAMAELRRALDGGNNAAMVAAAKALLESSTARRTRDQPDGGGRARPVGGAVRQDRRAPCACDRGGEGEDVANGRRVHAPAWRGAGARR